MHPKDKLLFLLFSCLLVTPGESFLLPILFPLSIKITLHRGHKPAHDTSYHFQTLPVYREVVVKGSASITPTKHSYGEGHKYGTSYADGHVKVYTDEPHIKGPKYVKGYGSVSGGAIDGHISVSSYPDSNHYKGSPYDSSSGSHYKGEEYPQTHYKGTSYDQGVDYVGEVPSTHYKGTAYDEGVHPTEYTDTTYDGRIPSTHYKGTTYDSNTSKHHKGTSYGDAPSYYKGPRHSSKPKVLYNNHNYIKAVGGEYKYSDYIKDKGNKYPEEEKAYVAIPPGKGYAEIDEKTYVVVTPGKTYTETDGKSYPAVRPGRTPVAAYTETDGKTYLTIPPGKTYTETDGKSYVAVPPGKTYTETDGKSYVAVPPGKTYTETDGKTYLAIPPGKSYAEIEAEHKAAHAPKAYAADQYSDLGTHKYNKEYEHDASYIDDTLPKYKASVPRPRKNKVHFPETFRYEESASRYDRVLPEPTNQKTTYAGFGTSIYGDSYAKIKYVPKHLRISIRAYSH